MIRYSIISLIYFISGSYVSAQEKYSHDEVKEDLAYLKSSLEETHYNIYAYTTKKAFDENFETIKASIGQDSISALEVTSLFQAVISKVNNGHTEIPFPGSIYIDYAYSEGTIFPLELAFENGKAFIRKNWSGNDNINRGNELLSINGKTMDEILEKIYPLVSAERRYFKLAKIELISFPRLYWQAFGKQDTFEVEIKSNSQVLNYKINSVLVLDGYEMKRDEIFYFTRELKYFDQAAYLRPGNFSGKEDKYQNFIDSCFVDIKEKGHSNLIVDLRNNLGGDDPFSDYLVSYIADQPFSWNSNFTLRTSAILKAHVREKYDTTTRFWKNVLSHKNGSIYTYDFEKYKPQPNTKKYSGNVYVLINRQSHSQSAVTAAQIQDYNFATIVGEETGDYPSLFASQYSYSLPHTGIGVKLSKGFIVRVNGSKKGEGVIPDIIIKDHLLDDEDEVLKYLLQLLSVKK